MIEVKEAKQVVLNEQGTANITANVQFENKSDQPQRLPRQGFMERIRDMVDIQATDASGRLLPHRKSVEADHIWTYVDLSDVTLDTNEKYAFTFKYTLPYAAKRFDNTYFFTVSERHTPRSYMETLEVASIFVFPKLFGTYRFWKEIHVDAPMASRVYTQNGVKKIEYHCVLPKGSHREFSFMFQERYNSKIVALLSFLLGVGLIQFLEWLIDLFYDTHR